MNRHLYSEQEIPAMMDVPQLGAFLGVGRNTAYALVRSGQIRPLHIGRKIRIPRHAVLEYLGMTADQ